MSTVVLTNEIIVFFMSLSLIFLLFTTLALWYVSFTFHFLRKSCFSLYILSSIALLKSRQHTCPPKPLLLPAVDYSTQWHIPRTTWRTTPRIYRTSLGSYCQVWSEQDAVPQTLCPRIDSRGISEKNRWVMLKSGEDEYFTP